MRCADAPVLYILLYKKYCIFFISKVHKVRCNECINTSENVGYVNNKYGYFF